MNLIQIDEELFIANNNISKLKEYLQENITSDLAPEIFMRVDSIEEIISNENLDELIEINKDINSFIIENNLKTESQILAEKKAEEKKIKDDKIKKEKEKKLAEKRKQEKANEGKHFFVRMLCEEAKNMPPTISNEEISVYAAMGIDPDNLHYVNDIVPVRLCECFEKRTKDKFTLERIKTINSNYKKDPKGENIMTQREQQFFSSLMVGCSQPLANKMEFWMQGGRP